VKRLIRDEKGQALVLALILLALGGLIIGPLLSYIDTGLAAGGVYERKAGELYAADAGVEDAIWKIQHPGEAGYLPCNPSSPARNYTIPDVNGKDVDVSIKYTYGDEEGRAYLVESKTVGDGSTTEISAYIIGTSVFGDFSGITNNVITSPGEINYYGQVNVDPETGNHSPVSNYTGAWPTAADLCAWYGYDVKNAPHYYSDTTINLNGISQPLGPLYVDGKLTIENSSNTPATLTLTGTIYATGVTDIGVSGSGQNTLIVNLNDNTIFVASDSTGSGKQALQIGGKCTLEGSGALIAVGDTYFAPGGDIGSVEGPVLTLSVEGSTLLQPSGNFYGSVAGNVTVDVKSGSKQNLVFPEGGFGVINFPGCTAGRFIYSIASWEVNQP
jgi:hypothetical protein